MGGYFFALKLRMATISVPKQIIKDIASYVVISPTPFVRVANRSCLKPTKEILSVFHFFDCPIIKITLIANKNNIYKINYL